MPPDVAELIKQSISMLDVCHQYGIQVNRAGFACCPIHGEKSPSMKVYPGNKGWHCFGCHQGGDVISFVRQYFGLDFLSAVRKLNDDFNLHLPIDERPDRETEKKNREDAYRRRKACERRQKRLVELQKARDKALTEFAELDREAENIASEASLFGLEGIEDPDLYNIILDNISNKTVNAVKNVDGAWYRFCESESKLRDFETEYYNQANCNDQDNPTDRR